ncbi:MULTISPECIES: hypothetical protein [unclassified Pseudomonas]|uniref:hypothetical protein n=1 Tax=unclassified Pseudomonas TaxID=196821 RepID=UPI000C17DFAE|nr:MULTISPECIES: hypothetical protein [unclassified Pseudomonas]MBS3185100.1 hypothetical protein [Pseudomonas sp. PCH44]PIK75665.1 hypothetical protein CQW31_25910 [Pseudomonas sp. 382]
MLHAFRRNKSQLYKRYLGHREEGEKRVCEEDEITALIAGPLDFLPPEASGAFWRALLEGEIGEDLPLPTGEVSFLRMDFWPKRAVEPDLLVEMGWSTGERRIIVVEFKWRAPLGTDQLHRQWNEYLTDAEREVAYHLFIGPELSVGLNALAQKDIWNGRLILRSWLNVLQILNKLDCKTYPGLSKWRTQVTIFLGQLDIKRFQGFQQLSPVLLPIQTHVFWNPLSGFDSKAPALPAVTNTKPNHFLWSSL